MTVFDPRDYRDALGRFATGVTVVTTRDADGQPVGVTANSYNSVSLDPPLILWSLAKSAGSMAAFEQAERFAVHILSHEQEAIAKRFAARGLDKFADLDFDLHETGVPILADCSARLLCETVHRYEGGDHKIFVGRVYSFEKQDHPPLLFHLGRFARVHHPA
ncbi:MAG: flavin reductase family protein [Sphingomonadales bacterium]|nr:flavin reductase family protein [Sphingomonadales bacterium]